MEGTQPSPAEPVLDRAGAESKRNKLPVRDHSVLGFNQPPRFS
jgi:hypothetical protein